jgi:hypothetical protein
MSGEMEHDVFNNFENQPSGPVRQWQTFPKEAASALGTALAEGSTSVGPEIRNPSVVTAYLKRIDTSVSLLGVMVKELSGKDFTLNEVGLARLIEDEADTLGRELGGTDASGYAVVEDLYTTAGIVYGLAPREELSKEVIEKYGL